MDVLKDKTALIKFLIENLEECNKERSGLMRLSESLTRSDPNLTPANMAKCLATTMKVTARQSLAIQNLAMIALIQCTSDEFDKDIALSLNKLGMGQEAMQQMFKNKFK